MLEATQNNELPVIPAKRYFTIGEVSDLCAVKPHVLRYWEQEFIQLKPLKRRGNRRYYQRDDVLVVRQIRSLLYDQGFTIGGARLQLSSDTPQGHGIENSVVRDSAAQTHTKVLIHELEKVLELLDQD